MKNEYAVKDNGDVEIYINSKYGKYKTIISEQDLERVKVFPNTWCLYSKKGTKHYIQGFITENGKRKSIQLHRWIMKPNDKEVVDHLNHKTLDNRRNNLKVCTQKENQLNRKGANKNNKSSGIRGVSWHKKNKKWAAYIRINGKRIDLGQFDNKDQAKNVVLASLKAKGIDRRGNFGKEIYS